MGLLQLVNLRLLLVLQEPTVHFYSLKDAEPERGLAWFVLNAFVLVGVCLGIAVGLGLLLGAFRTWLLAKYPGNRFNGDADDIRLDLDTRSEASPPD